ncbi:MAG: SurA N-terminal domain-containing protein [Alphaproteobacteria bacterium]|nr:SurA N-terminal domain-containing protein [Alphaproteobacteria bacterium]
MLKFFRSQKDSWFVKAILILTALSFMSFFGIQGMSEMRMRNRAIISLKGRTITIQEYLNEYNQRVETLRRLMKGDFSAADAENSGLMVKTLNELGSKAVIERLVDQLHLIVTDDEVRQMVQTMPNFQGIDGKFNIGLFNEYLRTIGQSEKRFISEFFTSMRLSQLRAGILASTIVPIDIAKMSYRLKNEKRNIDLYRVDPAQIVIKTKPTAEEAKKLYEDLADSLMAPEYRDLTVLKLTFDDVMNKIKYTDEELKAYFDENKAEFEVEEVRDVDQMLFSDQKTANNAMDALKAGQSFEKVAKDIAKQTEDQTHLGGLTLSTATSDWSEEVFKAKKGEIVGPVQTSFGWQIIRVNKITAKIEKSFASVKNDIADQLRKAEAFDKMENLSIELDERIGAGESLESIAKSEGLVLTKYKNITADGVDKSGKKVVLPGEVISTAFLGSVEQVSPKIEEQNSNYFVRVDTIVDPALKTMDEAKKDIEEVYVLQKQQEQVQKIVKNLEKDLAKGDADLTKYPSVRLEKLVDIQRDNSKISSSLTYSLFAKKQGEVLSTSEKNVYIVGKIKKVKVANPEKDVLGVKELQKEMAVQMAEDKMDTLLTAFGEEYNLEISEDATEKAFSLITRNNSSDEE